MRERLIEYRNLGAKFCKWRAVIDIGPSIPSYNAVNANAQALARYAALCQEENLVPIVEPEVLMDGDHGIDRCYEVTEWVLKTVYRELYYARVKLEGTVLKPNMVVPGKKSGKPASVEEVAEKTLRVLKACVPPAVPGIAFLSGGQSEVEATAHLDAMNKIGNVPWKLTFSYGRALQAAPQKAWSGKPGECRRGAGGLRPSRGDERACLARANGRPIWRSVPPERNPGSEPLTLGERRIEPADVRRLARHGSRLAPRVPTMIGAIGL